MTAFSEFTITLDNEVESVLSASVRNIVSNSLSTWRGEEMPLGRGWTEDTTADLDKSDRPAAIIALLAATAPYRLTATDIAAFKDTHKEDQTLIAVTGWGAYCATRRIASWLAPAHTTSQQDDGDTPAAGSF